MFFYFYKSLKPFKLCRFSNTRSCSLFQGVLLGLGLQHKNVEDLEKDLDLPVAQILGLFNKIIRKMAQHFNTVMEKDVEATMVERQEIRLEPAMQSVEEELVS